jgi:hypothetical protein
VDVGACAVRRKRREVSFGCSFCWVGSCVFWELGARDGNGTSVAVPNEEEDDEEEARKVEEGCLDRG